jgi:hypothetical protein
VGPLVTVAQAVANTGTLVTARSVRAQWVKETTVERLITDLFLIALAAVEEGKALWVAMRRR